MARHAIMEAVVPGSLSISGVALRIDWYACRSMTLSSGSPQANCQTNVTALCAAPTSRCWYETIGRDLSQQAAAKAACTRCAIADNSEASCFSFTFVPFPGQEYEI